MQMFSSGINEWVLAACLSRSRMADSSAAEIPLVSESDNKKRIPPVLAPFGMYYRKRGEGLILASAGYSRCSRAWQSSYKPYSSPINGERNANTRCKHHASLHVHLSVPIRFVIVPASVAASPGTSLSI